MTGYAFEIVHQFKGKGKVDEAEDWIRANVKGLWGLEFLGVEDQVDKNGVPAAPILHVRFKFGRAEDYNRFKNEFVLGKKAVAAAPARKAAPKKKGILQRLFGG